MGYIARFRVQSISHHSNADLALSTVAEVVLASRSTFIRLLSDDSLELSRDRTGNGNRGLMQMRLCRQTSPRALPISKGIEKLRDQFRRTNREKKNEAVEPELEPSATMI